MLCVVIRAAERRRSGAVLWSVDIQEKFFLEPVSVWILASHNWEEGGRRGPGGESWRAAPVEPALLATILDKISLSLSVSLSFLPLFSQAAAVRGAVQSTQQRQPSARCPHDIYTILFIHQARWSVDMPGTGIPTVWHSCTRRCSIILLPTSSGPVYPHNICLEY